MPGRTTRSPRWRESPADAFRAAGFLVVFFVVFVVVLVDTDVLLVVDVRVVVGAEDDVPMPAPPD
jgi:hypothetical protein